MTSDHQRPEPDADDSTGERRKDDDPRRLAAAHARSSADHESRADAALGEANAARGRSVAAERQDDLGTAAAEWGDAAGLDGLAAHEITVSRFEARAAAAVAKSVTVPATAGRAAGPAPAGQGRTAAPAPSAAPRQRIR